MKNLKSQPTWKSRTNGLLALTIALVTSGGVAANAEVIYGVSDQLGELISFDSASPGSLISSYAISGVQSGDEIRGIDWVNGTLYGLGDQGNLYTMDTTGHATLVGTGLGVALSGVYFGFNAGASQLYVSSDLGANLTVDPVTGLATVNPTYSSADVDALAYEYASGTFYGISVKNNELLSLNPVTGAVSDVAPTGVGILTHPIGFDISPTTGIAYVTAPVGGVTEIYTEDLTTGGLTSIGDVGPPSVFTEGLDSIAVVGVPEPATMSLFVVGGFSLLGFLRRRR